MSATDSPAQTIANAVSNTLTSVLEDIANELVDLDPEARDKLRTLQGRSIEIRATDLARSWRLTVATQRLLVATHAADDNLATRPNVIVSGRVTNLVTWLASRGERGAVQIDGDDAVLLELFAILTEIAPGQGIANNLFGTSADDAAEWGSRLLGAVELAAAGLRSTAQSFAESSKAAAASQFVDRPNFDELLDGIDDLKLRVDRLDATVKHRSKNDSAPPGHPAPPDNPAMGQP